MFKLFFLAIFIIASCDQPGQQGERILFTDSGKFNDQDVEQIDTLINRAWKFIELSAYDKAEIMKDSLQKASDHIGYSKGIGNALLLSGIVAFESGNVDQALSLEEEALEIFRLHGLQEMEIKALIALGQANEKAGRYTDAVRTYQSIFNLLHSMDNSPALANAYNDLGVVYFRMGHYAEALKNYLSALDLYTSQGNREAEASVKNNIGLIYTRQHHPEKAIQYFLEAISGSRDTVSGEVAAKAYINLGTLYAHQKKYALALDYHQAALDIFKRRNSPSGMTEAYSGLGITYFEMEKYPEALTSFQTSAQLARQTGNMVYLASALANSGNIYSSLGDMATGAEARLYYQRALDDQLESIAIADSIDAKEMLASSYDAITFTYKGLGDLEHALDYTDRLLLLKDSLRNSNTDRQLEEIRTQYEIDKAVALERSKRVMQNELAAITLGGLMCIGLLMYLLRRQKRLRKREMEQADNLYQLAELELQNLRSQLNPHFMFNSLNAIQDLILRHENEQSHLYLSQFSSLLRVLLENANSPFVPLAKEMEFLQTYIQMEKLRLPDLEYVVSVASDVQNTEVLIPNMILQPFVENAIWHGLSYKSPGDRKIEVRIFTTADQLVIEIEDNGIGRAKAQEIKNSLRKAHRSKGIELLKRRFLLIRMQYHIEIEQKTEDILREGLVAGTLVTITTPKNTAHLLEEK